MDIRGKKREKHICLSASDASVTRNEIVATGKGLAVTAGNNSVPATRWCNEEETSRDATRSY